ncbi:MAG: 50S ribosomal protein L4 [Coriobacteriia bacterium]|nr:50S ribosomal protein L4 [Coriobacteriia bacterium]
MSTVKIIDKTGKESGSAKLQDNIFGIKPNVAVMHQVVRAERASWRQGSASTKGRSDVSGGGRKPFRQKGTGRARQGTIRAAQMRGGGVVFGPHPRSYGFKVNAKEVKLGMRSALSAKQADKELIIVKDFDFKKPSTKDAVKALKALKVDGKRITLVISEEDVNSFLSFRNIEGVNVMPVTSMNTYDFVDNKALVITKDALDHIQEVLA